jgi:AcrR family transcriptional regulator
VAERPTFELESPMSQLSPTALTILKAARRLLARKGFAALSLKNIAGEAHVPKSLIRYHFGSKAALVEVLIDAAIHDANLALRDELAENLEGESRARAVIEAQGSISADKRGFVEFYEILPHVVRERALRRRGAALYDWYRSIVVWALEKSGGAFDAADVEALAALSISVCDGLAIQLLLQPETFDHERAYRLWQEIFTTYLRARATPAHAAASSADGRPIRPGQEVPDDHPVERS